MKKLIVATIATILILTTAACESGNSTPTSSSTAPTTTVSETQPTTVFKTKEHLELTSYELPLDSLWLADDLEKVGLKRISKTIREQGFITEKSLSERDIRQVALLCDYDRYGGGIYHDLFLAVEVDTKVIFKDLTHNTITGAYSESLYLNDVDGDGTDEIILHQCIGSTGGAGQYLARVFKVENEEINELFCSSIKSENSTYWDTGFEGTTKDGFMFEVTNEFTGYDTTFKLDNKHYIDVYYDENGNVRTEGKMQIDTFCDFEPVDKDSDGIYEISTKQYVSLYSHVDCIGYATSTIAYNPEIKDFEIIDSEFVSAYNMSDDYLIEKGEFYSVYQYGLRYYFKVTTPDGTVRDIANDISRVPRFTMLTDSLLEVKGQSGTGQSTNWAYYYDAEADKLSKHFYYILATNGELVAYCRREEKDIGIVVQDIFDVTKYCKRFDKFSYPVSTDCTDQIQSVTFANDGKSIEVVYLSGEDYTRTTEVFELTP